MAYWKYAMLTDDLLAVYYCTNCGKMYVQPSPTRRAPIEVICPNCHADMEIGSECNPRNCYTCADHDFCEICEGLGEMQRRSDSVCDGWREAK